MSLINDALQRAKEAQQNNPGFAGSTLQFRPAEPRSGRRGSKFLLLVVLAGLVTAGVFVWKRYYAPGAVASPVPAPAAADVPAAPAAPAARVAPVAPAALPVQARTAQPSVATNPAVPVVVPAPLNAGPPRLQAIVFDATRPSAIISGKTVHLESRVGEFRVVAIGRASVTLVKGSATNVLTLGE